MRQKNVYTKAIAGILAFSVICAYINWTTSYAIAEGRVIGLPDPKSFILTVEKEAFKMVSEYFGHLIAILGVSYAIKAIWGGQ